MLGFWGLRVSLIVAALAVSSPAWAGDPYYIAPAQADLADILAPPPAPDSPAFESGFAGRAGGGQIPHRRADRTRAR